MVAVPVATAPPEPTAAPGVAVVNLILFENQLTRSIPPGLRDLTSLINLNLTGNDLTGSIPPDPVPFHYRGMSF